MDDYLEVSSVFIGLLPPLTSPCHAGVVMGTGLGSYRLVGFYQQYKTPRTLLRHPRVVMGQGLAPVDWWASLLPTVQDRIKPGF
jgi:hypothetical protein